VAGQVVIEGATCRINEIKSDIKENISDPQMNIGVNQAKSWNLARIIHAYLSCSTIIFRINKRNTMSEVESGKVMFHPICSTMEAETGAEGFRGFSIRYFKEDAIEEGSEMSSSVLESSITETEENDQSSSPEFYKEDKLYSRLLRNVIGRFCIHEKILGKFEKSFMTKLDDDPYAVNCSTDVLRIMYDTIILSEDVVQGKSGDRSEQDEYARVFLDQSELEAMVELLACISDIYKHFKDDLKEKYRGFEKSNRRCHYFSNCGFQVSVLQALSYADGMKDDFEDSPYLTKERKALMEKEKIFVEYALGTSFEEAFERLKEEMKRKDGTVLLLFKTSVFEKSDQ
jgi:hypothetical protein